MTGKKLIYYIIFIIVFSITIPANAGELLENTFYIETDNFRPEQGVAFEVKIKAKDEKGKEIIEQMDSFMDVSFTFSNYSCSYFGDGTYRIILYNTGEKVLSASIDYKGDYYYTDNVNIEVVPQDYRNNDIFVTSELSDQSIYYGQVVVYSVNLYSVDKDIKYSWERYGDFKNLFSQIIEIDKKQEVYDYGRNLSKIVISKLILQPINTEDDYFYFPSYRINIPAEENNLEKEKMFQTKSYYTDVLPLPEKNKPENFKVLVGSLDIESDLDKKNINLNESSLLKVKLKGSCNLQSMDRIIYDDIPGFIIYQNPVNYEREIINGEFYNEKEFEIMLVPKNAGEHVVPEIKIDYFDSDKKEYKAVKIPAVEINVSDISQDTGEKDNGHLDSNNNITGKEVIIEQVFAEDHSRQINNNEYFIFKKEYLHYICAVVVLLFLIYLLIRFYRKYRENKKMDKELKEIYIDIKNTSDVHGVYNLFNDLIKRRYNISIKANTRSAIKRKIKDDKLLEDIFRIMDYYENGKES